MLGDPVLKEVTILVVFLVERCGTIIKSIPVRWLRCPLRPTLWDIRLTFVRVVHHQPDRRDQVGVRGSDVEIVDLEGRDGN